MGSVLSYKKAHKVEKYCFITWKRTLLNPVRTWLEYLNAFLRTIVGNNLIFYRCRPWYTNNLIATAILLYIKADVTPSLDTFLKLIVSLYRHYYFTTVFYLTSSIWSDAETSNWQTNKMCDKFFLDPYWHAWLSLSFSFQHLFPFLL